MSWLLLAILGIIWAAFLFPSRRSPTSSVEEFERKMTILADTHKASPGRWVLMPRKGHRFMGPQDRTRARARRRRRQLFGVLLEACVLTFLIGLFPPLRKMLYGTAILIVVLMGYVVTLLRIRALEEHQARARHLMSRSARALGAWRSRGYVAENGNGNGHSNGHANGNGHGNGRAVPNGRSRHAHVPIDEDAHVIVRTSEELEREAILAQGAKVSAGSTD